MKLRHATRLCGFLLVVSTTAGCASVVNPFSATNPDYSALPAGALGELASEIEREVSAGNREAVVKNRAGIVVETDEIRQAIRTRAARSELISSLLDTGHAWERRNGRIYVLRTTAYKKAGRRRDRDREAMLINGENRDRWTIYEGLLKSNEFGRRALPALEALFAEARFEFLKPGQKRENEAGEVTD